MSIDGLDPQDPRRIEPEGSPVDEQPAPLGPRIAARLIDGVIVAVFTTIVVATIDVGQQLYVNSAVFGFGTFVYFVVYESTQGRTLGKGLLGIRVLGPDSATKPTVRESAIRNAFTLLVLIPYAGAMLGLTAYLLIATTIGGNPLKQGVHDRWAGGTRVVRSTRSKH